MCKACFVVFVTLKGALRELLACCKLETTGAALLVVLDSLLLHSRRLTQYLQKHDH